jgi:hypothetical protein
MNSTGASPGDVTAALDVHPLQQLDGAEDHAGRDARGERERSEDLRSERPDVREAGLHQLQMPTVTGWALLRAADRVRESRGSQAAHGAANLGVIEVWVEDDVEDVVQQHETIEIRVERVELAFGDLVTGVPVGGAEHHVEHADRLIDDLRVRRGERGEQDRVAALGVHLQQRPRCRAPRDGRELPQPLRWNRAEIEAVRSEILEVGELRDLSLRCVAGRGRRAVAEPHQPRDPQIRVSDQQPVKLLATLGRELGTETPADLLAAVDAGSRHGSHQPVKAWPHDLLGSELVKRLPEQDRRRVVLQRPLGQPPSERAPLALPARPPAGVLDDRGDVTPARPTVRLARVASERGRRHTELLTDMLATSGGVSPSATATNPRNLTAASWTARPIRSQRRGASETSADPPTRTRSRRPDRCERPPPANPTSAPAPRPARDHPGRPPPRPPRSRRSSSHHVSTTTASSAASLSACDGKL